MHDRKVLSRVLLLFAIALPIAGCTSSQVDSLTVSPAAITMAIGTTAQLTATGVYGHGNHPSTTQDLTDQVAWTTTSNDVATVTSTGLVTATGPGVIQITASINGFTGTLTAGSTITVPAGSGGTGSGGAVVSLAIIPASQSVAVPTQTAQFLAIGTTTSGATTNLTDVVAWSSSSQQIATISTVSPTNGLATATGQGTSTITALYNSGGSTLTATAAFTVLGGTTEEFTAVTIIPASQSVSASGQTGQFIALATSGTTGLEEDVTNSPQITWISSIPSVATVGGTGLATGVSLGTSTITAELKNPDNSLVSGTSTIDVTNTPAPEPLLSLQIIPSTITVDNILDQGQFLAIGTYSTEPTVRDLTNSVQWLTSAPSVFPVNSNGTGVPSGGANAGIVTAYGSGGATIIAEASVPPVAPETVPDIQTATASFNCPLILPTPTTAGSCYPGSEASSLLSTLTIYNEGLNTTDWLVTAPSATGTPNVLHCGPGSSGAGLGGSVCVATYPVGTTITLTAPAGAGAFGGWSYNCVPQGAVTAAGPNTCNVTLTFDDTVGAIFN